MASERGGIVLEDFSAKTSQSRTDEGGANSPLPGRGEERTAPRPYGFVGGSASHLRGGGGGWSRAAGVVRSKRAAPLPRLAEWWPSICYLLPAGRISGPSVLLPLTQPEPLGLLGENLSQLVEGVELQGAVGVQGVLVWEFIFSLLSCYLANTLDSPGLGSLSGIS